MVVSRLGLGRIIVYALIVALALFVMATALLLRNGGDSSEGVMNVSVHDLSVAPQAHAEERVSTSGVLRLIEEPEEHFVITADGLGVVIRGYDETALRELAEREVTVTGHFGFDGVNGTYIEADSVTAVR